MQLEKTIITATNGLTVADLNGETILLDENSGCYYGLNEVGARILKLVKDGKTMRQLLEDLSHEYAVDNHQLSQELPVFLDQLVDLKLILIDNDSSI